MPQSDYEIEQAFKVLPPVLIVQNLQRRVEELEAQNQTLKDKLAALEDKVKEAWTWACPLSGGTDKGHRAEAFKLLDEAWQDLTTLAQSHRAEIEAKAREKERERIKKHVLLMQGMAHRRGDAVAFNEYEHLLLEIKAGESETLTTKGGSHE